ncbi:MAG TPA: M12 family metallo-peptidase [Thermoanaerobaculia bacterium]|nr:M12 family metallo-peptidase [Thermoanaerobaculia bacterium]
MTKLCHRHQGKTYLDSILPRGLLTAALLFTLVPWSLSGQTSRWTVRAVTGPGERVLAPDLKSPAERVTLDSGLTPRLLALPMEESLQVADWPIAPESRRNVVLTRHEVYAPDAKVVRVDGPGARNRTEVPRSRLAFYWGTAEDDELVRVFLSIDPATGAIQSFTQSSEGLNELHPAAGPEAKAGQHLVAPPEAFIGDATIQGEAPHWACGEEDMAQNARHATGKALHSIFGAAAAPFTDLHTATLAVDTDNELMLQKFNNDTTAATNYIASLFAAMTVMYERDLHVRLLQGTTFLRVSTTADPYIQGGSGNADGNVLNEFSNYWNVNEGSVNRALAMMLSGKQSSTNSASGIAWISGLCSKSIGYSFSQVFKINYLAGDALVVGHEIGHNFGSPHTHCYSPPADNCFNGEGGCYSGGTSCPAVTTINGVTNVTGTIMSYCHLLGGCTSSMVFHSRSLTEYINTALANANNVCILPTTTAPTVTSILPKGGTTLGGTPVTITGTNFLAGATVSIGGAAATAVVVVNSSKITAITGAHATGMASIAVTNPVNSGGSLSNGYFYDTPSGPLSFFTLSPCRLIDTRNPNGPLGGPVMAAGTQRTFTLTGVCGVPAGAKTLSTNVTITGSSGGGFLSFYSGNGLPFGTSNLSFAAGQTRACNTMLELASDGSGTIGLLNGSNGAVQVIVDVNGYFK